MVTAHADYGSSFFMSIGSVIRNESDLPQAVEGQWASAGRIAPIVLAHRMRAQQEQEH